MSISQNLNFVPISSWTPDQDAEIDAVLTLALAHLISDIERTGEVLISFAQYDRVIKVLGGEIKNIQGNFECARYQNTFVLRLAKLRPEDKLMGNEND